jgi:hypothetical protein
LVEDLDALTIDRDRAQLLRRHDLRHLTCLVY